jgi:hypothetical protein
MLDSRSSSTNALDLLLKYGAAFLAIAYIMGLTAQIFASRELNLPPLFRFNDAGYLTLGVMSTFYCFGPPVVILLGLDVVFLLIGKPVHWELDNRFRLLISCGVAIGCAIASSVRLPGLRLHPYFRLPFGWSVGAALAVFVVTLIAVQILVDPAVYLLSTTRQQLGMLVISCICLVIYAASVGVEISRLPGFVERARLLVAPDAVDGLKRFGIVFPDAACGAVSAQVTEPIDLLRRGESVYTVRTNGGKKLQIRNDKVWSVESPSPE